MSSFISYAGVFLLVVSLVAIGYQPPQKEDTVAANLAANATAPAQPNGVQHTVDGIVATGVAANIAERANLPVKYNIANLSQSLQAESELAQTSTVGAIQKPQIVQPAAESRSIQEYTTKAGDTIPSIAATYNISATTLKWANNMTSDAVEPGRALKIPPVDGVIYTIKDGDSADSISQKFKADKAQLVAYNDLELGGLDNGRQIIIPNGDLPEADRPGYVAPNTRNTNTGRANGSFGSRYGGSGRASNLAMSAGNRYAFGNCTWYAYERRVQLGLPVGSFWGHASTWAANASAAGLVVGSEPRPGSIMQNGGGYGHVAIVESVVPGVSVTISEMNGYRWDGGFNRIGTGTLSWSEAVNPMFRYIY